MGSGGCIMHLYSQEGGGGALILGHVMAEIVKCIVGYAFFFFSLALQPPWALGPDFQFHDHFTD
jgi:hypothetical protein